jgi:CheY-like chemotaxis protein
MAEELSRILYVDDEDDIRAIVEIALGDIGGFSLRLCASGAEGVEAAAADPPQLVLLDVMMPGMDGPATLAALRARPETSRLPVVFLTARVLPEDTSRFAALGVAGVIAKPFDPMRLADEVRRIWATLG